MGESSLTSFELAWRKVRKPLASLHKAVRGERLRHARERKHFSQNHLAERIGASANQIGRYETGSVDPSPYLLKRLSKELEVTTDYLLGLTDEMAAPIPESSLSAEEQRFLEALRRGKVTALRLLLDETLPQEQQQAAVSRVDITPHRDPL